MVPLNVCHFQSPKMRSEFLMDKGLAAFVCNLSPKHGEQVKSTVTSSRSCDVAELFSPETPRPPDTPSFISQSHDLAREECLGWRVAQVWKICRLDFEPLILILVCETSKKLHGNHSIMFSLKVY